MNLSSSLRVSKCFSNVFVWINKSMSLITAIPILSWVHLRVIFMKQKSSSVTTWMTLCLSSSQASSAIVMSLVQGSCHHHPACRWTTHLDITLLWELVLITHCITLWSQLIIKILRPDIEGLDWFVKLSKTSELTLGCDWNSSSLTLKVILSDLRYSFICLLLYLNPWLILQCFGVYPIYQRLGSLELSYPPPCCHLEKCIMVPKALENYSLLPCNQFHSKVCQ